MNKSIFAIVLSLTVANQAMANDAVLDQALARLPVPRTSLNGTIATTNTVTGGSTPEVEHESFDIKKHPDQAFASYDELKQVIGSQAVLATTTTTTTTTADGTHYRFRTHRVPDGKSMPKGVQIDDGDDIEFEGDAAVVRDAEGRPYVSHLQLHMRRATGPMIGRLKTMDLQYDFAPATGRADMVATRATADVSIRFLYFLHRSFSLEARFVPSDSLAGTDSPGNTGSGAASKLN